MKNQVTRKGFTTVELVIVIAVIAILATVLTPTFSNLIDKAHESAAMQQAYDIYQTLLIDYDAQPIVLNGYIVISYKEETYYFIVKDGQFNNKPVTQAEAEALPMLFPGEPGEG